MVIIYNIFFLIVISAICYVSGNPILTASCLPAWLLCAVALDKQEQQL